MVPRPWNFFLLNWADYGIYPVIDVKMLTIVDFLTSVSRMNFSTFFSSVCNSVLG